VSALVELEDEVVELELLPLAVLPPLLLLHAAVPSMRVAAATAVKAIRVFIVGAPWVSVLR
jgi:hypothetical protein